MPPRFNLMCAAPAGTSAQVITKHDASVAVTGAQVGDEITVTDATGEHKVPVTGPTAAAAATESGQMCGGFAGVACTGTNQYCSMEVGRCQIADGSGTCKPKPEICTHEFMPVCGCNGQTYPNACGAAAAGVNVDRLGECGPPAAN